MNEFGRRVEQLMGQGYSRKEAVKIAKKEEKRNDQD